MFALILSLVLLQAAPEPALARRTLVHDGQTRVWHELIPAACAPREARCMTVIVLHGGGGFGGGEDIARRAKLDRAAARDGFILLAPDALGPNWNDGRPELAAENDDVGFVRALLADVGGRAGADPARTFATGASNGGLMSFRLACEAPEVRAIAPVIANMGTELARTCRPPRPIPVFQIVGTADRLMPYEGGSVAAMFGRGRGTVTSAADSFAFWAVTNSCHAGSPQPEQRGVIAREAAGCASGATVRQWSLVGVGHGWPGAWGRGPRAMRGGRDSELDATAAILAFFREVTAR